MADLVINNLGVTRGGSTLLRPCSAALARGQLVAVVGPNGAGKSTLLAALAGLIPAKGAVRWDGADLFALPRIQRARAAAYLPQSHDFAWPMACADMVALGRFAHGETDRHRSIDCQARVSVALDRLGISHLADRAADQLSGGETALAGLARVLVADTPLLLLDEPVAALDIAQRAETISLLADMARDQHRLVIAVMHDLYLARRFARTILWLSPAAMTVETVDATGKFAGFGGHVQQYFGVDEHWVRWI